MRGGLHQLGMAMARSLRRSRSDRGQRGAVLVELAIILPILLLLSFATIEFARAITAYKVVVNQVRQAARYLADKTPGSGHAEAACLVRHGSVSCGGTVLMSGLASATVVVQDASNAPATHRAQLTSTTGNAVAVNLVTVTVSGLQYPLLTGGFLSGIFGNATSITFQPVSATMRQTL